MGSSKEYYEHIRRKWQNEYPSSENIDEVWDFYKECGYKNPQATFKKILSNITWKRNKLLDLGCDNGFMLKTFCDWFPNIGGHGIDINQDAIKKAKKAFPKLNFKDFDGVTLPYDDNTFDLVFVCAVVKHIRYEDRKNFYKEIRRVTNKVFFVEADSKTQDKAKYGSWTFYNSNFEQEFKDNFIPIEVIHESGDLLGLYNCK